MEETLLGFQVLYERIAQPFEWKFTRTDLAEVLAKLSTYQPHPNKTAA